MSDKPSRSDINSRIGRISIRGKEYATVDARVLAFWEMYPDGRIETQLLSDDGDRCIFKAVAYDMDASISTGHAFELRTASAVNKTSYIENCETSAVGRALAFLGIGSNGSIASAEEVAAAIEQQAAKEPSKGKKAPQKAPDGLKATKQRAWAAMKAWGELNGRTGEQVLEGVKKRPDYAETEEFFNGIADEFEGAV